MTGGTTRASSGVRAWTQEQKEESCRTLFSCPVPVVRATATWCGAHGRTLLSRRIIGAARVWWYWLSSAVAYMNGMIPHHSLAITRSERAQLADVRVCELAVSISEAQRREIQDMSWLIEDIEANGPATTTDEAEARAVPAFVGVADRAC
jgi:hypothetical protein